MQRVALSWMWDNLEWVWVSEGAVDGFVVSVGQFGVGLRSECAASGFVVGV